MICTSQENTMIFTRMKEERKNLYIPNYVHIANINRKTSFVKEDNKKISHVYNKNKIFHTSSDSAITFKMTMI